MKRVFGIWFAWVMAVIFFAAATHLAPEKESIFTAPEAFLFALGVLHLIGGAIILGSALDVEIDWL